MSLPEKQVAVKRHNVYYGAKIVGSIYLQEDMIEEINEQGAYCDFEWKSAGRGGEYNGLRIG